MGLVSTMTGHQDVINRLMEQRVIHLRRLEVMQDFQKFCAKEGDREGAKFFKEEVADARKYYRAACLLIPHVASHYPGDCNLRPIDKFPLELIPAASHIIGVVTHEVCIELRARDALWRPDAPIRFPEVE